MSGPVREPQGHRVWRFGADINTDVLAPGAYMKLGIEGIAPHCLESVRPEFAGSVQRGDVIVAGGNFGIGSSREQAAGLHHGHQEVGHRLAGQAPAQGRNHAGALWL